MKVCPSCGRENPDDARFCSGCATPLEETPSREERKVVTVLFADLVGFTSRAERLDPEDVRAILSRYHDLVRSELERFGGTVEKFIGDAVMALFGAPVAHEDDPERAVRAALAIRDALVEEGKLHARIGVTTGEALVALAARPARGEGMASGDVVNTAARLQTAAPEDAILVDETTNRATDRAIEYREHPPVEARGKSQRVPVWEAMQARSRFGVDVRQIGGTPLVGRRRELETLVSALERAKEEQATELVTLVGVPGIGKSRLVWELFQHVDQGSELVRWRNGRSLPYGEGVTFWALGEMVKAEAGILETDGPEQAAEKLARNVETLVEDAADARWLETRLRPLVGLEAEDAVEDRRAESFAAWRRYLEALADARPTVLVFEDLHWADDDLLDFVDHLVDWASGVPLLVVATARPELLSRRPGWGGGKPNALTLSLSPLSDDETAKLVHFLLDRAVLPVELQQALLERAGGNPLYAEEFARLTQGGRELAELPESVQGIVAARIDGLADAEKSLLQAAAVVGKVFWLGSLAAVVSDERRALEERLHVLERTEFVRRERRPSVAGETEYAFRHVLVRDVAYAQIPRAARAAKHVAAARWMESLGRAEDHAEMVAHHYLAALELTRASGGDLAAIAEPARAALREAGERAFALNAFPAATRFYAEALELWPEDDRERPTLLFRYAQSAHLGGDARNAEALADAAEALLRLGDRSAAAQAEALLAEVWWHRGLRDECFSHLDRARELVADEGESRAKAHVLSQASRYAVLAGENERAVQIGREALSIATALGLDEVQAHALDNIGVARLGLGDRGGFDDLEQSIQIALAVNSPEASRAYNNLGAVNWVDGDLRRARELFAEAVRVGERLGGTATAYARGMLATTYFYVGEWDEALRQTSKLIAECEAGRPHNLEHSFRMKRAGIRFARGEDDVLDDVHRALEQARQAKDPQALLPTVGATVRLYADLGMLDEARSLANEHLAAITAIRERNWFALDLVWAAERLGCADELRRAEWSGFWGKVYTVMLERDWARAADMFEEMGDRSNEALARLEDARQLVEQGRRAETDAQLTRALRFFRSVGASRYVRAAESLLAASA